VFPAGSYSTYQSLAENEGEISSRERKKTGRDNFRAGEKYNPKMLSKCEKGSFEKSN
jgi:hypothetical protein